MPSSIKKVAVKYNVIGLMSGTSLDGLDIACCEFIAGDNRWSYKILCAETIAYSREWKSTLSGLESASALEYVTADIEYGHLLGRVTREFIARHGLQPGFIASHGHTVFHQPEKQITSQIGSGAAIAAETGLPVVCDFRTLDVALGGQGAPLVPAGDRLLFGDFDCCVNLGGFANISYENEGKRIAYDICPANIVLNYLALRAGCEYDAGGMLATSGTVNGPLLAELNNLPYYRLVPPKSLGKEWVLQHIIPLLETGSNSTNDLLATYCEHIAVQVASASNMKKSARILVTGGGAFNKYLISRIRSYALPEIFIPDALTVNFKEALVFAFLGVLRQRHENNCLQSVTGASRDSSGGAIY